MKKSLTRIVAVIFLILGVGLMSYPWIANKISEQRMSQALSSYDASVEQIDDAELAAEIEKVKRYDDNLTGQPVHDPFDPDAGYVLPGDYEDVLNVNGDGIMGSISIPVIDIKLPIYHGVGDEALAKGVGHIEYTSTPYGGPGRHSWMSAHRGLPHALLFTDLDKVQVGDSFFIDVLGETHAYRVTEIEVVKPEGMREFRPTPDKDLVTLVTCTPYGINTERLLVTGERYPYTPDGPGGGAVAVASRGMKDWYFVLFAGAIGVVILTVAIKLRRDRKTTATDASQSA